MTKMALPALLRGLFPKSEPRTPPPQPGEEQVFAHAGRQFRYVFRPGRAEAPLLITLHGHMGTPKAPLFKSRDWNLLFPIDDHGFRGRGSWYLGERGDFFWLEAMKALVDKVHRGGEIWLQGAGMGGFGAIAHGLNLKAAGVYAHSPQTRLLETAFGQQGLRLPIHVVFGGETDSRFGDLRNLLDESPATRFFISAYAHERAEFLDQQVRPFVDAARDTGHPVSLELLEGEGPKPPLAAGEAAQRLAGKVAGETGGLFPPGKLAKTDRARVDAAELAQVDKAIETVIHDPAAMWAKPYPHMVGRFEEKLALFARRAQIPNDPARILEHVRILADQRTQDRPRTLFVASPGGSGSHLFQKLLAHNAGTVECGEVYLPEEMMQLMAQCGRAARGRLIDTMHLLHAYQLFDDMSDKMLVNTAHARGWRIAAHMPEPSTTIFLQRDPYDVVMSRAFRKQGMRRKQFSDKDDREYLQQQIDFVLRFYEVRDISRVDAVVHFEQLRDDPETLLRALASIDGVPVVEDRIAETVAAFSSGRLDANKYRGPKVEIPEAAKDHAKDQLADLRDRLGYRD